MGVLMRVNFPNLERPKKAARRLCSRFPNLKLHVAQKAVARSVGYTDWHELERSYAERLPTPLDQLWTEAAFRAQASSAVNELATVIETSDGEALFAFSTIRLTGDRVWTMEDHTALRIDLWRKSNVFNSARRSPGSVVRMNERGRSPRVCYLCSYGRPTRVLYDTGIGHCADFEVVIPRNKLPEFLPARLWQPYGVWRLKDDSEVVFSRDYFPLWRISGSHVQRLPPWLWIEEIQSHRHFLGERDWMWWEEIARTKGLNYLAQQKISGLPILSETLPLLLQGGIETIKDAVKALMNATTTPDPLGPWHRSLSLAEGT